MQLLGKYYGADWVAMLMTLLFLYLIGNKKRYAFILYIIGNVAWIFTNYLAEIWPGVILNVVLIFLNIRGYKNWHKA